MAKNSNKKKNRIIAVVIAAVIIALFVYARVRQNLDEASMRNRISIDATTVVSAGDMVDSLSGSGIVQSEKVRAVVPTLNAEVTDIKVELGDYVNEGDVLALLDSEAIDRQVDLTRSSNYVSVETARLSYETAIENLEDMIDNGQTANDEIWTNWTAARDAADAAGARYDALLEVNEDYLAWMAETDPATKAAMKAELDIELTALGLSTDITMQELSAEVAAAAATSDAAQASADALGTQLATNNAARFDAQDIYDQVMGLKPVTSSEAKQLILQRSQLANTADSLDQNLDMLKEQQDGAVITANMDGTITSVGLTVGQAPAGIAFTIQDLSDLSIQSSVKERDLAYVEEGMDVIITSNAIPDTEYHGTLENIAPTGTISATGDTVFTTKIVIDDEDGKLKPGMNVKVKYILFEKDAVMQVPYDSVYTVDDSDYVLIMKELSDGKYELVPTLVSKGGINDINIEITEGVEINDRVVNYPENYLDDLSGEYELYTGGTDE